MSGLSRQSQEHVQAAQGERGILASLRSWRRREWQIAAGIFALALLVRLVYLWQISASPTFYWPIVDADTYNRAAQRIAQTLHPDASQFWQGFLYPLVLGGLYLFSGSSILFARLAQALLGCATCVLSWRLGRRVFDDRVGVIAGAACALYGPMIFYETDLVAAGLGAFWSVALLHLFLDARQTGRTRLLGFCGAMSVITRPTFLPFFIGGCVWLALAMVRRSGGENAWGKSKAAVHEPLAHAKPCKVGATATSFVAVRTSTGETPVAHMGGTPMPLPKANGALAVTNPTSTLARAVANLALGFAIVAGPVALLSWRATGRPSFLPNSGGINLYIGNNPRADETINIRPGWRWEALVNEPRMHGLNNPAGQGRYFSRKVVDYAWRQPLDFLAGLGSKTLQFISSRELPRNEDLYVFRQWSPLLAAMAWKAAGFGFPFGLLLPLAAAGLALRWAKTPAIIKLYVLLMPAATIMVFVSARYRVPTIPVFAILAAVGAVAIFDAARQRRWGQLGIAGGVIAATAVLATLPGPFAQERPNYQAELYLNMAGRYRQTPHAQQWVSKALAHKPDLSEAHAVQGLLHLQGRRLDAAETSFLRALTLENGNFEAHHNLGRVYSLRKEPEKAVQHYRAALEVSPLSGQTHYYLAVEMEGLGQAEQALRHYLLAGQASPELAKAHSQAAELLLERGRMAEAAEEYRLAMRHLPAQQAVTEMLGLAWILSTAGDERLRDAQEAASLALRAMEQAPTIQALDVLAAAYAEQGRFDEAIATAKQAMAQKRGNRELLGRVSSRLAIYQAHRPFRMRPGACRQAD